MKLFNSLSHSLQDFKPLDNNQIRMYSCGPTVYDRAHIGNLSAYIFADTLRRALELQGNSVKHVMNYTDVDDKTIKRSNEEYPDLEPKQALKKLTDKYIKLFLEDARKVGIDTDKIEFVRATDSIDNIQKLIKKLVDKKIAYITKDGIYFSIEAYKKSDKKYGQLLKISDSNTSSARIDNDEYDKESIHDFALWKAQKPGDPAWDFEIDGHNIKGRPGWHIECSAMSESALGLPFDIHTGGVDLIFPHHENEIAQSTAANGNTMANFFVHNNHLLVDGRKMAKSANNFYTLDDIIKKGYDPIAFRLLVLQSHYRNEINFTWKSMDSAQNKLNKMQNLADLRFQIKPDVVGPFTDFDEFQKMTLDDLRFNLNTPEALAGIDQIASDNAEIVSNLNEKSFEDFLDFVSRAFGLYLLSSEDIDKKLQDLIDNRESAKSKAKMSKDWSQSDKLRDELAKQGIGINDTEDGPIWYRT